MSGEGCTVRVQFPGGERRVPAEIRYDGQSFFGAAGLPTPKLVPTNQDDWEFQELVDGRWVAFRTAA